MTLSGSGAAYTIAHDALDAVKEQLAEGLGGVPARSCVVPGAIAWDECDTCGQLAIAAQRIFPTTNFPTEDNTSSSQCGSAAFLGIDFTVQIIRCAPTIDESGNPPSCDALDRCAKIVMQDAYYVICAITTLLDALIASDAIVDYLLRQQLFIGPEGACTGSDFVFTVGVLR